MEFDLTWGGLHKVISGGQTGADQGGLMAAWRHGVETGGQAPECYKIEGGYNPILEVLGLSQSSDYAGRTKSNISASDGTVIVAHHLNSAGTALTRRETKAANKPLLELNILPLTQIALKGPSKKNNELALEEVIKHASALCDFIIKHQIQILNVAGNREIRSTGAQHGHLIITQATEWIVGMAIETLAADGKIITKQDKRNF